MNKRDFLKTSSAFFTSALVSRFASGEATPVKRTNWAGNYTFHTNNVHTPANLAEVQQVVKSCQKLRALGSRHSFNGIADSTENQVTLQHLNTMQLDEKARVVTVGSGITYGKLAPWLDSKGYAIHNLASLPHISVAGGVATATHGSGVRNGNLSSAVAALQIVKASGNSFEISRAQSGDHFRGAVVALGGLGVVTGVSLNVEPTFQMTQVVYENLSFDELEKNLHTVLASGYSVSLFTDWQKHRATQVWLKNRVVAGKTAEMPSLFYGATLQREKLHPLAGHSAENCTEQMGTPGPWYERMPHFRMNFTPSSGAEIQSEYFVPIEDGYKALLAVEKLRDKITPHLFISEIRSIAADDFWMSPVRGQDSMAIHFTWKPEEAQVRKVLPLIEAALEPFNARPHWAKVFTMQPARIKQLYPKLPDFQALLNEYDPTGKFRNQYMQTNIFS